MNLDDYVAFATHGTYYPFESHALEPASQVVDEDLDRVRVRDGRAVDGAFEVLLRQHPAPVLEQHGEDRELGLRYQLAKAVALDRGIGRIELEDAVGKLLARTALPEPGMDPRQ